jgi:SAM-dependent methyltransferase
MPEPRTRTTSDADVSTADGSVFGASYYQYDCGLPYGRTEEWIGLFTMIADRIVHDLKPRSVLDAGCAMGLLVEQLCERGVDAYGIDISEYAISQVPEAVGDRCRVGSLIDAIDGRYDLVTCIEVVEHMVPDEAQKAIANMCAVTDRVLFSSSPNDYAEATHVNVRPPEGWAADFAAQGFFRDLEFDATFLTPWALLYRRGSEDPRDIVREYERAQARLEAEIGQLRAEALKQLAEREAAAAADDSPSDPLAPVVEDLQEQLLAMRDTVVGLEVELGEAIGQNAYYLAMLAGKDAAAREYERVVASKAYRAVVKTLSPYRRVRRFLGR